MNYSPVPSTIPAMDMRDQSVTDAVRPEGRGKRKGHKMSKRGKSRGRRKSGRY